MSDSVYVDRIIWRRIGAIDVCRACGFVREDTATAELSHRERCYAATVYGRFSDVISAKDAENVRLRSNMAAEIERQTAIAAAERALRLAETEFARANVPSSQDVALDRRDGAIAGLKAAVEALVALGIEP